MSNFTSEELIQYLYQETSPPKTASIRTAILTDWKTREQYESLKASHQILDEFSMSPRKESIEKILNYAGKPVTELTS